MRHIPFAAFSTVLVYALTACSDRPSLVEPATVAPPTAIAATQGRPTDVDETPFTVNYCSFPIEVVLSGKGKTIELPGGRSILTSPGLTATLTNLNNQNREVINITGASHLRTLGNGNVEIVLTGRNVVFDTQDPGLPNLILAIGRFSEVVDAQGNFVQTLQGKGQLIDLCALLA